MDKEQVLEINKALANLTRLEILNWLKDPESNFPPHSELGHFDFGVCGQFIKEKSGLSQPTISHYLAIMNKAGLLTPTRHGKWTYFKRNEKIIQQYIDEIKDNL
ncbi:helix-turn-helix transcriptional regulator [Aquimarina sp. MMG015]|uniref:ArsR/SmtB family transcription factor n=1 Tax=Aquimarina TaxID=290174 RepID=UPI0004889B68|nr:MULTISPECIES: helix-turn-helix transcriptional regulator [Aquimarina]AXT55344.1 transcriptional regulator [Aquimarina sp. AD1]MBQ4802312.1 helix-turn-helix transcriptional regulator [Aquimarina sp. MMG015]RKN20601.1 transcriptional regulator [Aquimarina sp. AD1]